MPVKFTNGKITLERDKQNQESVDLWSYSQQCEVYYTSDVPGTEIYHIG